MTFLATFSFGFIAIGLSLVFLRSLLALIKPGTDTPKTVEPKTGEPETVERETVKPAIANPGPANGNPYP